MQKWGLFVRISSTSIYMGKLGPEEVWKREKMIEKVSTQKELGEREREREQVGFHNLKRPYDRVQRKAQWQVVRMHRMCGKLIIIIY